MDEGQYYLTRISYRDLQGQVRFPVQQNPGIDVDASDSTANFGTIKVTLQQNITSKIAYVTTYAYPYSGTYLPSALKPTIHLAQIPDRDVTHQYIEPSHKLKRICGHPNYSMIGTVQTVIVYRKIQQMHRNIIGQETCPIISSFLTYWFCSTLNSLA